MVTPEQKKEIISLFEKGISSAKIAETMGLNPPVIWGIRAHWSRGKYSSNQVVSEEAESLKIISALADGINPENEVPLPANHILQSPSVIRAMFHALRSMEKTLTPLEEHNAPQTGKPDKKTQANEIICDEGLFERLYNLRTKIAGERGWPTYCIFPNYSLRVMARDYPTTIEEFKNIKGVGEKRSQDLGPIFMREISQHLSENPRKLFEKEKTPTPKKKPKERRQLNDDEIKEKQAENIKNGRPKNSHLPWSAEQCQKLIQSYLDGNSIKELATTFGRSGNGISSKLGFIAGVQFELLEEMSLEEKRSRLKP